MSKTGQGHKTDTSKLTKLPQINDVSRGQTPSSKSVDRSSSQRDLINFENIKKAAKAIELQLTGDKHYHFTSNLKNLDEAIVNKSYEKALAVIVELKRFMQQHKCGNKGKDFIKSLEDLRLHLVTVEQDNAANLLSAVNQNDENMKKHIYQLWAIAFGKEKIPNEDCLKLLEKIVNKLQILEKMSNEVEEQCSRLYEDTQGSIMTALEFKSPLDLLGGAIKNLKTCHGETFCVRKYLNEQLLVLKVVVKDGKFATICRQLEEEIKRLQESSSKLAELEKENATLITRLHESSIKIKELENEKTTLLNRLSKMAGANLTDNNPNIADLSDQNRPTKLAEMYSELYDNAWTDAYEILEKSGKDEKAHISTLYSILTESYRSCKDISSQQKLDIVKALTEPKTPEKPPSKEKPAVEAKLSALHSKAVTEMRRQSADVFVKSLQTFLKEKWKSEKRSGWFNKGGIETYTKKCIELCWFMHVQVPPVHIDLNVKSGEKFDSNKFKQYMKSGNKIDFVVWPPLLLHEGGSLLSKGVAQGK